MCYASINCTAPVASQSLIFSSYTGKRCEQRVPLRRGLQAWTLFRMREGLSCGWIIWVRLAPKSLNCS